MVKFRWNLFHRIVEINVYVYIKKTLGRQAQFEIGPRNML